MDNHPAIQVQDLYKSYKGVQAVQGMNFGVPQGEIFGLLGPNSAGGAVCHAPVGCDGVE